MAGNANSFLNKYSDIVLALVVVAIVGMMIVPLPTHLLDILLTFNIASSVMVLLVVVVRAERAAASVVPDAAAHHDDVPAGARRLDDPLILLDGDAGRGGPRVRQLRGARQLRRRRGHLHHPRSWCNFIVISKGAERVAEVAARFTLDAMPGKQMSIDADLRAGAIDMEEGKRKRRDLERESRSSAPWTAR